MLSNILETMLSDMSKYHRDKNEILVSAITERLNNSLKVYYKELSDSLDYLRKKDELKMLKKMNRYE